MDYNRVQSYIKSHVLPKLDSLPQDVQSVKNAFDVWRADWTQARAIKLDNLDAKVSTRATAADMSTALERIETNITETLDVKNKMPFVTNGTTANLVLTTGTGNVINITGKGALYLAGIASMSGSKTRTITIGIDGTNFTITDRGGWSVNSGKNYWIGYMNLGSYLFMNYVGDVRIDPNNAYLGLNSKNFCGFSNLQQGSALAAVSYSPLVFKENLTITINNSENKTFTALYELEE